MKTTFKILLVFTFFISGFQFTSVNAQGRRLPHLDYVPEFPYPVRIVKTSNDDTRIHKKIKYVTFMTSLTPIQVKTFYKHFLMKNGWGVDASINNQVFGAALVMHPKPGYTKDGRPIIYVGGRPTTATISQKYYVPVINSKYKFFAEFTKAIYKYDPSFDQSLLPFA